MIMFWTSPFFIVVSFVVHVLLSKINLWKKTLCWVLATNYKSTEERALRVYKKKKSNDADSARRDIIMT